MSKNREVQKEEYRVLLDGSLTPLTYSTANQAYKAAQGLQWQANVCVDVVKVLVTLFNDDQTL